MYNTIRVLLADKPSLVGVGIRATLNVEKNVILLGEANDNYMIQELHRELKPDLLIIDLDIPKFNSPESIAFLCKKCPNLKVLAIASQDKVNLSTLKVSGIGGCVFKSEEPETLISAIRAIAKGNTWYSQNTIEEAVRHKVNNSSHNEKAMLTRREQQVLNMIAQGLDNVRIATELRLGHQTVRNYISQIYAKLAVNSRTEAMLWVMRNNTGITLG